MRKLKMALLVAASALCVHAEINWSISRTRDKDGLTPSSGALTGYFVADHDTSGTLPTIERAAFVSMLQGGEVDAVRGCLLGEAHNTARGALRGSVYEYFVEGEDVLISGFAVVFNDEWTHFMVTDSIENVISYVGSDVTFTFGDQRSALWQPIGGGVDPSAATWSYDDNGDGTITITGFSSEPDGELSIPSTIDGKTVTGIGNTAFEFYGGLTSVVIPDSVTSIGGLAFAFSDLTSVTIGNGVTNIGEGAFYCCRGLTNVWIPDSVTSIGWSAFEGCTSLHNVVIPNGVDQIYGSTFRECGLTSVTIGDGVTDIWEGAFTSCSKLTNVIFRGNAPTVHADSPIGPQFPFDDVASNCVAYVSRSSTGWGVEIPGTWQEMRIEYFDDEPVQVMHAVTFDLGVHGTRTGGGEVVQTVTNGCAAVEPEVETVDPRLTFIGWDRDVTAAITNDVTFTAQYSPCWEYIYAYHFEIDSADVVNGCAEFHVSLYFMYDDWNVLEEAIRNGRVELRTAETLDGTEWRSEYVGDVEWSELGSAALAGGARIRITTPLSQLSYRRFYKVCIRTETGTIETVNIAMYSAREMAGGEFVERFIIGSAPEDFFEPTLTLDLSDEETLWGGTLSVMPYDRVRVYYDLDWCNDCFWGYSSRYSGYSQPFYAVAVNQDLEVEYLYEESLYGGWSQVSDTIPNAGSFDWTVELQNGRYAVGFLPEEYIEEWNGGNWVIEDFVYDLQELRGCGFAEITVGQGLYEDASGLLWEWEVTPESTVSITGLQLKDEWWEEHGYVESLYIPSTINGRTVTGVQSLWSVANDVWTSVTIPDGVTSIGNDAFYGCGNLTNVTFRGNAPAVYANSFSGVAEDCVAYVSRDSTGWGVEIPGTWNGMRIEYIGGVEPVLPTVHTVTFDLGAHGTRSGGGKLTQAVTNRCFATVPEVVANPGWRFTGWDSDVTMAITSDTTFTAQWERMTFPVVVDGQSTTYSYGDEVTFAAPEPLVVGNGTTQIVYLATTYTAPVVTNQFTVTVTNSFSFNWDIQATNYWLAVGNAAHGSIGGSESCWKADGEAVSLSATPAEHYHFVRWTGDVDGCDVVDGTIVVTMDSARRICAQFAPDVYAITYADTRGAANPNPTTYTVEDRITFTRLSDVTGWWARGWNPTSIPSGSFGDKTVTAQWERMTFPVVVDGQSTTYSYGDEVTFAAPEPLVVGNGTTQIVYLATTYTAPVATNQFTVTVTNSFSFDWDIQATNYWLAVGNAAHGAIGGSESGWKADGDTVSLSATPAEHYHFVRWTGDVDGCDVVDGTIVVTMDRARRIGAEFAPDVYSITYADTRGAANPNPTTYTVEDRITFTRLPDITGWWARGWKPASIPSGSFGDKTVTAQWERMTFPVVVDGQSTLYRYEDEATFAAPEPSVVGNGTTQIVYLATTYTAPVVTNQFTVTVTNSFSFNWDIQATNYWLAVGNAAHGSIGGSESGWKADGDTVSLSATPAEHYHFVRWTGDVDGCDVVDGTIVVTMDRARRIGAEFAPDVYSITYADTRGAANPNPTTYTVEDRISFTKLSDVTGWWARGWNPTSIPSGSFGDKTVTAQWERMTFPVVVDGQSTLYRYEDEVTFAAPEPSVVGNGTTQIVYLATTYTAPVVTNQFTVTVTNSFSFNWDIQATNYWLAVGNAAHGSIGGSESGWKADGEAVSLSATPAEHYHFVRWTGDVDGCDVVDGTIVVTMDRARRIGAEFAPDVYSITYADTRGAANPNPTTYTVEDRITFTRLPGVTGWWARGWKPASISVGSFGDKTVTAQWERMTFPVVVDGQSTLYRYEDEVTFAAPEPSVVGNGTTQIVYLATTYTAPVVTNQFTVTVTNSFSFNWDIQATNYWLAVGNAAHGSIGGSESCWKADGEAVSLSATPAEHYHFVRWTGDVDGCDVVDGTIVVTMDRARRIGAEFAPDVYSITYADTRGAANSNPLSYTVEEEIVFSRLANMEGWAFVGWSPAAIARGSTGNLTVTAQWVRQYAVTFDLGEHGTHAGGGALSQFVREGLSGVEPSVRVDAEWVFDGWDCSFAAVTNDMTVTAKYRSVYADLHVDEIAVRRVGDNMIAQGGTALAATSGDTLVANWTVGNTGNPAFTGTMTEYVRFIDVRNPSNAVVVATLEFDGTLARDGTMERSAEIALPLKGMEGEWVVEVETAANPSVMEYAGNNTRRGSTVMVEACPLPDLVVGDVTVSPTSFMPGDTVTVTYVEMNFGTADTVTNWLDRIVLEDASGKRVSLITLVGCDVDVTKVVECVIPEMVSLSGEVRLVAETDIGDDIVEVDDEANNVARSEPVSLGKRLYLESASDSVKENDTTGVRFVVRRSGPVDDATEVTVMALGGEPPSAGVTVNGQDASSPSGTTVTIPAGSVSTMFYVKPIDNATVEGPRTVDVAASADGFASGAPVRLAIIDDEVPHIYLALDKTSVREGDGVILATVTRELVTDEPLTVYLSDASTGRVSYPSSVVIPGGESSVTFEISVPNNETAQIAQDLTLRVSSSGYLSAAVNYTVEDDDVPGVTLSLTPEVVSEGAGAQAIYATLTRSDANQIAQAVRVRLAASEENQLILPEEITIPKNTLAVRFAVGVVDNSMADGDREISIDGTIVIESCGCNGQASNGDVIHAMVGVIDDDSPALALKAEPTTMREGLDPAGYLILSRNSALTEDLTVRLWAELGTASTGGESSAATADNEIDIPETVTIPAGESSVQIPVRTLDDGVEDGGQLVSVYAEVDGDTLAPAATWVQVSDQNLPDLTVAHIETVSSVVALEDISVTFTVTNIGFMATSRTIPYAVHLVKGTNGGSVSSSTFIRSGTITGGIAINGATVGAVSLVAPELPGDYRVAIVVDPDGTIPELDSANNTGWSSAIGVTVAYAATAGVDKKIYLPGETVTVTGVATRADGTAAGNMPIDPYVMLNGMRRSLLTTTDVDGSYSVTFTPSAGEAGDYTVGACYPGVNSAVAQDSFAILGMTRSSNDNIIWDIAVGESATRTVTIQNRSAIPLTGLTATFTDVPDECSFTYALPETIPANGSVVLSMTASAVGITEQEDYEKFFAHIEAAEGVSFDFPLYFYSRSQGAYLRVEPTSINTTMTIGKPSYLTMTIMNDGKGDSGPVSIALPNVSWMRVIGGSRIENIHSGEYGVVTVELTPPLGLILNHAYDGIIAISCEDGNALTFPLRIIPVSDEHGGLCIDVVDTLTLTSENSPHVEGALVTVANPGTTTIVASGTTGSDGVFECNDIPAGKYTITIAAEHHSSANMTVMVSPGVVTRQTVFLDYQSISYVWKVVPTEIEDQYTLDLVTEYDTNVPIPVMLIHVPEEIPNLNKGESYVCAIEIENTGLIDIVDVGLSLSGSIGEWKYEQISPDIKTLPAKSSQTIYVKFTNPILEPTKKAALYLKRSGTRDLSELDLSSVAPCTIGMIATARALCGKEGVNLLMRSKNIRIAGHLCDLAALVARMMGGWGWLETLSDALDGGDPCPPHPHPSPDPKPTIREPVEVEKTNANCAALLNILDEILGWIMDKMGLGMGERIYDGINWQIKAANGEGLSDEDFNTLVGYMLDDFRSYLLQEAELDDQIGNFAERFNELSHILDDFGEIIDRIGDERIMAHLSNISDRMNQLRRMIGSVGEMSSLISYTLDWLMNDEQDESYTKRANSKRYTVSNMMKAAEPQTKYPEELISLARDFLNSYIELHIELDSEGIETIDDFLAKVRDELKTFLDGGNALAVCSTIRFKLSQTVTMTREAFEGTLTLENGEMVGLLSDVKFEPRIIDSDGNVCNDLFGVTDKDHSGFSGTTFLGGDLSLESGMSGTARILFVPTHQAAPMTSKVYYFGGVLSYFDNARGEPMSHNLVSVPLIVNPSPYLKFDYFIQRDVYSDDPFTEIVEASMPAELAVLIRNTGFGDAKNVTIHSMQPEIIDNVKGLAATFKLSDYSLDATALNGSTAYLGLNDIKMGTIAAQDTTVAQWWLNSTIEGHFVGIETAVTHANTWGNADTSLIDPDVGVHKLVRSIVADGDALPDFLVCDGSDLYGKPNEIYTARGDVLPVYVASVATSATLSSGGEIALPITLTPARSGWNYGYAAISGIFGYTISRIVRGDGLEIPLRNAWITDRTFRDGNTPLLEDRLHIVDEFVSNAAQAYTVYLVAKVSDVPEVASFEGVTDGTVEYAVRDAATVVFTKPIDTATFTVDDLTIVQQGAYLDDLSAITITAADGSGTRFTIGNLSDLCSDYGRYELTVQCAGIADLDGNLGRYGKSVAWTYAASGSVAPQLVELVRRMSDGFGGMEYIASFDRGVKAETVTLANWTLRRNGDTVSLNGASLRRVEDNAHYQFVLSGIDEGLTHDGEYELQFSSAGVTDVAGHAASGSKSVSWTVDTTPPAQITDLAISPDGGFSNTDGVTYTGALTVTGTLPEAGLTVGIIARYVGGGETVLATIDGEGAVATQFSQNITLPGSGNVTLVVRLTDAAGNSSETEKGVYVDGIALTGALAGASEDEGVVTASATLSLSDRIMEGDVTLEKFSLARDGETVALEGVTLAARSASAPYQWELSGLDALCAEDGQYVLRFDGSAVRKYSSGLTMAGSLVMRWRYKNPDSEPPTVTEVLFDGETPHEAYTNVFSSVSVTFNEAVNVPELIEKGLIGRAARVDLLDATGVVTGCVATVAGQPPYRWDAESNMLSWQIESTGVPAGRARLMLDAGLITDLAGNRLAADANGQDAHSPSATGETPVVPVAGLRNYTLSETVLAQVNAQAMPMWHNGEFFVGEKTAGNKGKIRHYAANGSWSYLQSDGVDIEIPAQGCQGASMAFADMDGDGVVETYVGTTGGDVLKYPGGTAIASLGANRAMPYVYDIDDDGRDELITGGMDGRIRIISLDEDSGTYSVALISDVNGAPITVLNGRAAPIVADINHDGLADIVSGDTAGNVWAYLGVDATSASLPVHATPISVFTNNVGLADRSRLGYGDVNGDGIEDLIVGRSDGSVTVMYGAETPSPAVPFAVKAVVSASVGTHGAIAPVGDATYDGGDSPEYTITPDVGYNVADVQIDGVSIGATNNYVFAPLTTSHEIHADFVTVPYVITYTGLKGAANTNPETYTVEDEITFSAPGEVYGWVFKGWTPASIALGSTGAIEVSANWERQKFDVTVNGETWQYSYEDMAEFATNAVINCGATQYVCKGWAATNAEPTSGEGERAEFRVLGDVTLRWLWETNVVTLAQSVNAEGFEWTTGGAAEWTPEWSDEAADNVHQACCGAIPNGTNAWLAATVDGPGTIVFKWRSALASRNTKYQFMVDGEVKGMLSGTNDWTETSFAVLGDKTHEIKWRILMGRSGSAAGDGVALDCVAWTPTVPPTLAEALNTDLVWTPEGDALWRGVARESLTESRDAWAVVSGLGDDGTSAVQTRVYGSGILFFDWAISCEEDYDWMELTVDGEVRDYISGTRDWTQSAVEIVGDGWHVVRWEFVKDEMDDPELAGENVARLDNVVWSSDDVAPMLTETQTTPVPVPYSELETRFKAYLDAASGDYEAAAHSTGLNGYAIWECYVAGLEPDNPKSKFIAKIEMVDGKPVVTWEPDTPELRATRIYTTYGKKTLLDRDWTPVTDENKAEYNFFKVEVTIK